MNSNQLRQLLQKPESASLEFKRELNIYKQGHTKRIANDELMRDIIALANGNPAIASQPKYLIIGRGDKPTSDGAYELYDTGDKYPSSDDLLKRLAGYCYPPLDTISSEPIIIDGKQLLVITIPPTPYLHETTKELKTPQVYNQHVVFIRRDESIGLASERERAELRRAKQHFFSESENVPPVSFGAFVGAVTLAPVARYQAQKQFNMGILGQIFAGVIGTLIGGSVGGITGRTYKDIRFFKREWPQLNQKQKTIFISLLSFIYSIVIVVIGWLSRWRKRRAG